MSALSALASLTGPAIIVVFILAIRLSYAIEARSDPMKAKRSFGYTNIWGVALNMGVARDAETQALRKRLLLHLAGIALLFIAMAVSYTYLGRHRAI